MPVGRVRIIPVDGGSNDPGTWKPGGYRAKVFLNGNVIAEGSFTVAGAATTGGKTVEQKRPVFDFSQWPLEYKLDTAFSRLIAEVRNAPNTTARDGYTTARDMVDRARREYDKYKGPQDTIYSGSTDPADCPYGTMKVLRICAEDVFQSRAAWDRSPRSPTLTDTQVRQLSEAIRNAEEAIQGAVREVDIHRGCITHTGDGVSAKSPADYEKFQSGNWPLALRQLNSQGKLLRAVLITWKAKPSELSEKEFQEQVINERTANLPNYRQDKTWQTWPGVPGHWFTFRYTWEGQEVDALIYQNPFGPLPWEVRFMAGDCLLDPEVCEEIVRSLNPIR